MRVDAGPGRLAGMAGRDAVRHLPDAGVLLVIQVVCGLADERRAEEGRCCVGASQRRRGGGRVCGRTAPLALADNPTAVVRGRGASHVSTRTAIAGHRLSGNSLVRNR